MYYIFYVKSCTCHHRMYYDLTLIHLRMSTAASVDYVKLDQAKSTKKKIEHFPYRTRLDYGMHLVIFYVACVSMHTYTFAPIHPTQLEVLRERMQI